jgi:type II secretory pathway predicted ATPase ExeA
MSIEKLQSHWGFTVMPFRRNLPVASLHRFRAHAEAAARIRWLIGQHAFGVLTGEVGAGKTAAARAATAGLDASRHTVIYLPNPAIGSRGILGAIVTALGETPRFHYATLIPQTAQVLDTETAERGRQVILIIDEAHLLDPGQLEAIRILTSADMDSRSPLACLLIGQPTLRRRIKLGAFAALDQRITLRYAMPGMSDTETKAYISHHTAVAGRTDTLFSDDAAALIHQTARGLPRAVNNLAIAGLIAAFATGKSIVDESAARSAVTEITTE